MLSCYSEILSPDASYFLEALFSCFQDDLKSLLEARQERQKEYDLGKLPDFLEETASIRDDSVWKVSEIPHELLNRRVEITGPTDRKMVINALNSGANVFMADFEDSLSPTWKNIIEGQKNLKDAVNRTIAYDHPTKGTYTLDDQTSVLFVRPRGLHLKEKNFEINDSSISASLFDFGIFMYHNANELVQQGTAPYFYLPKIEHYLEARWWNNVFNWAQDYLSIPRGTIRATVLIETLPAAFQMDEILYELKDHSAGLNCGRWDYIFSFIKTIRNHPDKILPNRSQVTMMSHCMKSYRDLLIHTCHKRGIHAMGGMAAQIPIRDNPEENEKALQAVREDKIREVLAGHDGTWVAHPGLIQVAKEVFDEMMPHSNQIEFLTPKVKIQSSDLLKTPQGEITEEGLRNNINIGIRYVESWLRGNGCVPLYNLMEDAATAEISRTQVWQWIRHGKFTEKEFKKILSDEVNNIRVQVGNVEFINGRFAEAVSLFEKLSVGEELENFLTLAAYKNIA